MSAGRAEEGLGTLWGRATVGAAFWRESLSAPHLIVITGTGLIAAVCVGQTAAAGLVESRVAVVFGVLIAVGEVMRMEMPGNREAAPIASAGALGYALLHGVGGQQGDFSAFQAVAVVACSMAVGALPHVAIGRPPRADALARRVLTAAIVAFAYRPIAAGLGDDWRVLIPAMACAVMVSCMADVLIAALLRSAVAHTRPTIALLDEMRAKLALCAASGATAMLIAVATEAMGLAMLIIFIAPILVTQFAFRRYSGISATYLQTVRALSRVTEVGGYVGPGHSRRVGRLAVATGRELGMAESELLRLEYAALMHDIGQLSLRDPIPGGATVLAAPAERRRIAALGAEIIKKTGVLDDVAEIVRGQSEPFAGGTVAEVPPSLASRIIRVTNAYDDLVGESGDRDRRAAVLDRLRIESAAEYDPTVVEALGRVVSRLTTLTATRP